MDAWIEDKLDIDGGGSSLTAGETTVFNAIVANDESALAALVGTSYNSAYDAAAQRYRTSRAAALPARRQAAEHLGVSYAGIRASAISLAEIAEYIGGGDRSEAILAKGESNYNPQNTATIAAQSRLSTGELAVLKTVWAGGGLEAALSPLPTLVADRAYTDGWKNWIRLNAKNFNAGNIKVDITGGTITADGNGVEAFYAVSHNSNGAITVSTASGTTVTGDRSGVFVHGAGVPTGVTSRAQTVTVNGDVTGGTGVGVHLAGGGALVVGATGEVSTISGVGVLADGGGDASVTVTGSVTGDVRAEDGGDLSTTVSGTVDGDVHAQGGGVLTLNVREGGTVTGTVHDPASPLTLAGSVGRLLYTNGGTLTVAATGRLTGVEVEGRREALGSEAGDLDLTVAGTVTGDVLGLGAGEHTVTVSRGGTVTGTIHLAASTVSVDGTAGRVRFDNGGTVRVGKTGRLTGIEVGGQREALRNEGGALSLTVTSDGRIEGNVVDVGERRAAVTVEAGGTVTGSIDLSAKGSMGTVHGTAGRVRLNNGCTFALGPAGRITGIGGQTLVKSQGDLVVNIELADGEKVEDASARIGTIQAADGALTVRVQEPGPGGAFSTSPSPEAWC